MSLRAERDRGLARRSVALGPGLRLALRERHEEPTFKKLGLATETIRNLTAVELAGVAGGLGTKIVTTTKSMTSACLPPLTTTGDLDTTVSLIV